MRKIFVLLFGVGLILIVGIRLATPISQPIPKPKEISRRVDSNGQ
jgi:hypothetical protein